MATGIDNFYIFLYLTPIPNGKSLKELIWSHTPKDGPAQSAPCTYCNTLYYNGGGGLPPGDGGGLTLQKAGILVSCVHTTKNIPLFLRKIPTAAQCMPIGPI